MIHVDSILDVECGVNQLCPFCHNEMMDSEQIELITAHGAVGCAHSVCIAAKRENERESWYAANIRALWKRKHILQQAKERHKKAEESTNSLQQLKAEIRAICIDLECTSHDKFDCGMYHALRGRLRELSAV